MRFELLKVFAKEHVSARYTPPYVQFNCFFIPDVYYPAYAV